MDSQLHYRQLGGQFDRWLASATGRYLTLRAAVLAAAATAHGDDRATRAAFDAMGRAAVPGTAVYEAVLQTYLFAGYPRAINALNLLAEVYPIEDPAVDLTADRGRGPAWAARGEALCRRVYGESYPRLLTTIGRASPDLARWMVVEGYGKVLSRDGLEVATRELAAVAALACLNVPDQLRAHVRGVVLVGAEVEDLQEVWQSVRLLSPKHAERAERLAAQVLDRENKDA